MLSEADGWPARNRLTTALRSRVCRRSAVRSARIRAVADTHPAVLTHGIAITELGAQDAEPSRVADPYTGD